MESAITSGPWRVELPNYQINRCHYIICKGKKGLDYQRLFVVSESVTPSQEAANAHAAAAIPQMLEALQQCPSPPEVDALSPQQLKDWEKSYKAWYRVRCDALAKATETPDEVSPQVDVDAMRNAFCAMASIQSPDEVKYLIQATEMEVCHLLDGTKRQKVTVAKQESFTFTIAHHAGIPVEITFVPVYLNQVLFLFWESVGAIFWKERLKEWIELVFAEHPTTGKTEQFRDYVAALKKGTKPASPKQ